MSFQNCFSILIKEDNFNTQDREDIRSHAEASVLQFMDCARQVDQSFLQKRLLLSVHRPDWIIKEVRPGIGLGVQPDQVEHRTATGQSASSADVASLL